MRRCLGRWRRLALGCVLLAACGRAPEDVVVASGTIEATEIDLAPLAVGRLVELRVREGDSVRAGDTVAVLARAELAGQIAEARARLDAARAALRLLEQGARAEDVAAARATLTAAETELEQAGRELERVRALAERALATPEQLERVRAAEAQARGRRDVARQTLNRLQAGARREELEAARAEVAAAEASYAQARAASDELVLMSPVAGVVLWRNFEPGEAVPAGRAVVTLLDPADLWLRVYVGQNALARLRLGQPAEVVTDAAPGRRFAARVVEIAPRAEFTPRAALTERERADLVFAVRLAVQDPSGTLKPGMPADGWIRVEPPARAAREQP